MEESPSRLGLGPAPVMAGSLGEKHTWQVSCRWRGWWGGARPLQSAVCQWLWGQQRLPWFQSLGGVGQGGRGETFEALGVV